MPAYYAAFVPDFLCESDSSVAGKLAQGIPREGFQELRSSQISVWTTEIECLKAALSGVVELHRDAESWALIMEFPIPRIARRIDAVILTNRCCFVLEFKENEGDAFALRQVEGYALDLADFHKPSLGLHFVPIVVANHQSGNPDCNGDVRVASPAFTPPERLGEVLWSAFQDSAFRNSVTLEEFDKGEYHPIPPIIDAARAIFRTMDVREIADAGCGEQNLSKTIEALRHVVAFAAADRKKVACFVTGVPGSGKTLAGLTIAHDEVLHSMPGVNVSFFSGNGPLVKVLREALVRDRVEQVKRKETPKERAKDIRRRIEAKIQNIHAFARAHFDDPERRVPYEQIVVFDEAQRAWNAERNRRKFRRDISEPKMVLSILDRHEWCVLIALVGGGQEIHDGEAGLAEWGVALGDFKDWYIYAPESAIVGSQSTAFMRLENEGGLLNINRQDALQLNVSTRSVRSKNLNDWCNHLLKGDIANCRSAAADLPIWLTRSLSDARQWLCAQGRGLYRCGLVASSGAARLRPLGIETSTAFHRGYPFEHWFLDGPNDLRSSYQLEVAATEFEVQGLELDFVGLCWGGDLVRDARNRYWLPRTLSPTNGWRSMRKDIDRQYLLNSYRVLLTRARLGTVVWVPSGDANDPTRSPDELDLLATFLADAGARALPTKAAASA